MTQETKQTLISAIFAIGCVMLYFFYPVGNSKFEIFLATMIFLLGMPLLYNKIILQQTIKNMELMNFSLTKRDVFLLVSSVIIGGFISFLFVSMEFGIQRYVGSLSATILQNFKAFAIYELLFSSLGLFLFSFFVWGFVRSIVWHRDIYAYLFSLIIFGVLIMDFYSGFFIAIPFMIPAIFLLKMEKRINPIYVFIACYAIGLIFDTIIVKSFVTSL